MKILSGITRFFAKNTHFFWWLSAVIAGTLILAALTLLAGFAVLLLSRPQRTAVQHMPLFKGITYTKKIIDNPRATIIHIIEIDLTNPDVSFLVTPPDTSKNTELLAAKTTTFLEKNNAQVAVNGGFFGPFIPGNIALNDYYPKEGDPVEVFGQAVSGRLQYSPNDVRSYPKLCIEGREWLIQQEACEGGTDHALSGSHLLVRDGVAVSSGFDTVATPAPRSVVANSTDGKKAWIVVVDGRQPWYSEGMTYSELSQFLMVEEKLAIKSMLNLDGGGSVALAYQSVDGPALLNSPVHTRLPMRERPVANHLGVFSKIIDSE